MADKSHVSEEVSSLKADIIYLLMRKKYHVSCNIRVQWYLDHLNTYVTTPPPSISQDFENEDKDLTVVSVLPLEPPSDWLPEVSHCYRYLVTPQSSIVFLTHRYRFAFCLDMSPSVSAVDTQHGEVMSDETLLSFRRSVEGMVQPFTIPGSCVKFQPEIYVTVIAHTPFFATPAQQVLVQGWRVTPQNVKNLLSCVESQLVMLEDVVADVTRSAHEQLDALRAESERLVGDLFEEEQSESQAPSIIAGNIPMVSPDAGFINMLRYGLLALRLLPDCSSSNLVVLTDGVIATPDVKVLDSVVTQLRANAVACSFIQLGSRFHPHCCAGLIPYRDLLQYLAGATQGSYVTNPGELKSELMSMNFYHKAFLTWSFRRPSYEFSNPLPQEGEWNVSNHLFYGRHEPQLLSKKQAEDKLNISLHSLLCCRLHQGYTVKGVCMKDGQVELNLVQAWNSHIYLDYKVTSPWPGGYPVHYSLSIQAPYEFLHDITCLLKKPLGSPYRQLVVTRFWHTLKILGQSDQLLVHLHSLGSAASTPPDVVRSGMPLFYPPSLAVPSALPVLASSESSCQQFATFWRPLTMLDPAMWQRWLHTHNLVLLLRHDIPLPQYLHLPNNSGRYQVVQCRHAALSLYALLKDWSSFVLIDNHSYVKFVQGVPRDPSSSWFFLIRATSKPPCVVVQLAFLGGTSAELRYQMVEQLSEKIQQLTFPQRPLSNTSLSCCLSLHKPVDKILIRYERMPSALDTVVFPDGTQPAMAAHWGNTVTAGAGSLLTTLSRYLYHRRWVWAAQSSPHFPLGQDAIARILATLTKTRLKEGFCFAHSTAGIINMVLEVEMIQQEGGDEKNPPQFCVVQYVLFPPHLANTSLKDSGSEDEGVDDADANEEGEMQLVMECWVEPQHGKVTNSPTQRSYMNGLPYFRIADAICQVDAQCISSLLTMEHVRLMCEQGHVQPPQSCDAAQILSEFPRGAAVWAEPRIQCLPFAFNLTSLLPLCQQAELLFSMYIQDLANGSSARTGSEAVEQNPDAPNQMMLNIMLDQLSVLHDRELPLSEEDSERFMHHIRNRNRPLSAPALPIPDKCGRGNWRCFVRRTSPNRVLLTIVPASFADLKAIMVPNLNFEQLRGIKLVTPRNDTFAGDVFNGVPTEAHPDSLEALGTPLGTPLPTGTPATPHTPHIQQATPQATPSPHTPSTCDPSSSFLLNHFSRRLRTSHQDVGASSSLDSPFRMRAASWDPKPSRASTGPSLASLASSAKRPRTSSMGAKAKPCRLSLGTPGMSPAMSPSPSPSPSQAAHASAATTASTSTTTESSPLACPSGATTTPGIPVPRTATPSKHRGEWDRASYERSMSCEASVFRTRTQSMDSKNKHYSSSQNQVFVRKDGSDGGLGLHRNRSSSIDLKLKLPTRRRTISSQASYTLGSPNPDVTPTKTFSMPVPGCGQRVEGSITLPVYVFDCPLTPSPEAELDVPADIFEDRTFKWDWPTGKSTPTITTASALSRLSGRESAERAATPPEDDKEAEKGDVLADTSGPASLDSTAPGASQTGPAAPPSQSALQQMGRALSLAYSRCFVLALFESLQSGLHVHAVDVQQAVDECEEALVEVDITRFLHTVCGHLNGGGPTRCHDLKLLHRLIKDKFRTILHAAFRPVTTHPEFHYCVPAGAGPGWDHKRMPGGTMPLHVPLSALHIPLHVPQDPLSGPLLQLAGWDGVLMPGILNTPDDAHTSLLSNMDSNSMSEVVDDTQLPEEVSPLFLHLVCSVHAHGDMASYATRALPTCVTELARGLDDNVGASAANSSGAGVGTTSALLASQGCQVTLDILCLTLTREPESLSLTEQPQAVPPQPSAQTPQQQLAVPTPPQLQQQLSNQSSCSMDERLSVDQLAHLPEHQQRAVNKLVHELRWLMRDEVAACALDEWPVTEATLSMVAEHISSSLGRSTCLLETVPLHFVYETGKCLEKFLEALVDLRVNGYRLQSEGVATFYMVKDASVVVDTCETPCDPSEAGWEPGEGEVDAASTPIMPRVATESTIEQSTDGSASTHDNFQGGPPGAHGEETPLGHLGHLGSLSGLNPDSDLCNWSEAAARNSEVSSLLESALGTEDGYDGGSSDSAQDCAWLLELERSRDKLPNFWIILRVEGDLVYVYFHCRFLDMETEEVSSYRAVFTGVLEQLRRLCIRVNQTLLLSTLNDTFLCDALLEPEQADDSWTGGDVVLNRLKSLEDNRETDQATSESLSASGRTIAKFEPGHFSCGVVWETNFMLHHRLKTGPGKGGLSRGIQALRNVLNRLSVTNRRNMFVYKDKQGNVFYLRLHENQRGLAKMSAPCMVNLGTGLGPMGSLTGSVGPYTLHGYTGESSPCSVSRSSSTASLNTSRRLHPLPHAAEDVASVSSISGDVHSHSQALRPRVRSFGEKDVTPLSSSGEGRWSLAPSLHGHGHHAHAPVREDYITLRVHGISDAGGDVRQDLMQVLQNRLDVAVLDVLSVMLARNPMCKLAPEDVHFIQRPNQPPETSVQFSVPAHAELHVQALAYYLHQDLLHFVHQPKYTEPMPSGHFQDYSQPPDSPSHIPEGYLYLYNQNATATGSRGIACLAMGVMDRAGHLMLRSSPFRRPQLWAHAEAPLPEHFQDLTTVRRYWPDAPAPAHPCGAAPAAPDAELDSAARVEFRIWQQGRVNMEALVAKLESAVKHAVWDLLTEFTILTAPIEEAGTPAPTPVLTPNSTPSTTPNPNSFSLALSLSTPQPVNYASRSQLHPVYHKSMQPWLEYAVELGVASVRKHNVQLASRHSLGVAVQELESLITTHAKDTRTAVFAEEIDSNGGVMYRQWRWNDECNFLPTRCLLLTRNTSQWRCFVADPRGPPSKADAKVANKGLQKFLPLLGTTPQDHRFVPRQRFLLTVVTSKDMAILTYNWSKECVESLNYQTTLLGHWLSARSGLLTSIICQKMGLFHNQPCLRTSDNKSNPYLTKVGDLDMLTKFPRKESLGPSGGSGGARRSGGWSGNSGTSTPTSPHPAQQAQQAQQTGKDPGQQGLPLQALQHVFRDRRAAPLKSGPGDLVVRHARQMLATRHLDKDADHQRKLNSLWQNRGGATPNIPLAPDVLQLFLQHARTIHYCLTPLLFLPRWRVDSAATRDHSLSVSPPTGGVGAAGPGALRSTPRSTPRTTPRGTPAKERRGSSASMSLGAREHDRWHATLCAHFVHEYQQYLQTLGFIPVHTEPSAQSLAGGPGTAPRRRQSHFLQKSLLGGVLMVELLLAEPFFHSRLHALECSRMQTKSPAFISQFTVSFLDECDKVKVLLHLHSFAYDYHLRTLHGCVTSPGPGIGPLIGPGIGPGGSLLPPGYHLTLFLDDFLKYYSKAPNFARNLVHADTVVVSDIATPGVQLFSYLLQNDKAYGMEVFRMAPVTYDEHDQDSCSVHMQSEFVLVQHKTTPHLSYRDVHDLKQTDDFDVTLIVTHDPSPELPDQNQLKLKYFIVLTSRRELYPKAEVERKQGKFRTVSTANVPGNAVSLPASTPPPGPPPPPGPLPAPTTITAQVAVPVALPPVAIATAVPAAPPIIAPIINTITDSNGSMHSASPSAPSTPAAPNAPVLLEVVTQDVPGALTIDRLPSPASEATPDLCSVLVSLESHSSSVPELPNTLPISTESESFNSDSGGQLSSSHHVEIRQEAVNYLGYYSSHEQLMGQLIHQQAATARNHIVSMVTQGAMHCRTHMLWTRLMCPAVSNIRSNPRDHQGQSLSFSEFRELVRLAEVEPLSRLDPRLKPLLAQPLTWYQGLARVLLSKYSDHNRQFFAPDSSAHHIVILHPRYPDAFVMLSLDNHTARGDLAVVYRMPPEALSERKDRRPSAAIKPCSAEEIHPLVEGLVNACCFHLWSSLL
ncbi:KICSTOR complex protein SZT2 isoform X2 [Frankliniella occidentalis]|uniref:KICSTOR complex protein SZT2 isoform X2 n=1 Tax=Frankliniella occidentalis TaxID=133901 RepID=A0A9C6UDJ8_FRAOC|nr:KICSTOR complex protein SZT2 isoform X2 [Frankliniella occidentalis]